MQSYRHPEAHWFGTPNYTADRAGHDMAIQPAYVVLHTMVGSVESANSRFQRPSEQASATYGIGLDGRIYQWVDEKDGAWANGTWNNPGGNMDSISIEHEDGGDFNGPRTADLYAASARLVRDICQRYGIPVDRQHILKHLECNGASTACPDGLDVDGIVRTAAAGDSVATQIEDRVHLRTAVQGRVWTAGGTTAFHWESLPTVMALGHVGIDSTWSYVDAVKVRGLWYDRLMGAGGPSTGDWAVLDESFDTAVNGAATDPAYWRKKEQSG